MVDKEKPFYPVSMAAELLNISADRLRAYEEEGLIKPHRVKSKSAKIKAPKRLYSQNDIEWIGLIRDLLKSGLSIPSIRLFLYILPYINKKNIKNIDFPENNHINIVKEQWNIIIKLYEHPVYKQIIEI